MAMGGMQTLQVYLGLDEKSEPVCRHNNSKCEDRYWPISVVQPKEYGKKQTAFSLTQQMPGEDRAVTDYDGLGYIE